MDDWPAPRPIRHREFRANLRREFARLTQCLQAYALVARGVRLLATNQTGSKARTSIVMTQGTPDLWDGIVTVFGSRTAAGLQPLHVDLSEVAAAARDDQDREDGQPCIRGHVSKPGAGVRAHGAQAWGWVWIAPCCDD